MLIEKWFYRERETLNETHDVTLLHRWVFFCCNEIITLASLSVFSDGPVECRALGHDISLFTIICNIAAMLLFEPQCVDDRYQCECSMHANSCSRPACYSLEDLDRLGTKTHIRSITQAPMRRAVCEETPTVVVVVVASAGRFPPLLQTMNWRLSELFQSGSICSQIWVFTSLVMCTN